MSLVSNPFPSKNSKEPRFVSRLTFFISYQSSYIQSTIQVVNVSIKVTDLYTNNMQLCRDLEDRFFDIYVY